MVQALAFVQCILFTVAQPEIDDLGLLQNIQAIQKRGEDVGSVATRSLDNSVGRKKKSGDIPGYTELTADALSGVCKTIRPEKVLNPGVCCDQEECSAEFDFKIATTDGWTCTEWADADAKTKASYKHASSPKSCAKLCTTTSGCKGFEVNGHNKGDSLCKLWFTPPLLVDISQSQSLPSACYSRTLPMSVGIGVGYTFGSKSARKQVVRNFNRNPGMKVNGFTEIFMGGKYGLSGACRLIQEGKPVNGVCCDGVSVGVDAEGNCPESYWFLVLNTFEQDGTTPKKTCVDDLDPTIGHSDDPDAARGYAVANSPADCAQLCNAYAGCHSFELAIEVNGRGSCELHVGKERPSYAEDRPGKDLWCYRRTADMKKHFNEIEGSP